jgi:FkbM family methyltransferase
LKADINKFIVVKFKHSRLIELIFHFIVLLIPLSWIYLLSRFTRLNICRNSKIYIISKAFARGIFIMRFNEDFLAGVMLPWMVYVVIPIDGLDMQPHVWIWNDYEWVCKPCKGGVVIDVGAHVGLFTLKCLKVFKVDKVVAIEPHPANYLLLKRNIYLNRFQDRVLALRVAAGSRDGYAELYLSKYSHSHSLIFKGLGSINVQLATIDSLIEKLSRVDFVKIDVEGYEIEVIKGMRKLVNMFKPVIVMEVFKNNVTYVKKIMDELGYNIKTFPDLFTPQYHIHCTPANNNTISS